jgi:hypothetical protein
LLLTVYFAVTKSLWKLVKGSVIINEMDTNHQDSNSQLKPVAGKNLKKPFLIFVGSIDTNL